MQEERRSDAGGDAADRREKAAEEGDLTARRAGLLAATLASFVTAFLVSSIYVALPALQKDFGIDAVLLSWIPMSAMLASAMAVVPMGRIADIYGRRRLFITGMATFTITSLLCATSRSAGSLIAFMVIQGIGAAMVFSTSIAIVTAVYPVAERGKVLGITVAAVYFGLSSGPFFGGQLTGHFGWRSIYLTVLPLGLIVISAVSLRLKQEWRDARGEKFDLRGSLMFALSLLLIASGFSMLPAIRGFLALAAGLLLGVLFCLWESRIPMPIIHVDLLKGNRVFAVSNLAALIHYSATSAITFLISLYLQYIRAMTPQQAGMVLVCQPLVQAILTPFAGRLSDRIDPKIVSSIGMAVTTAGTLLLSLLTAHTPIFLIIGNLCLLGVGFALFSSPNLNAVMSSIDKRFYGVGSGILATARMVGQVFSMGFTVLVFSLNMGRVRITPELYPLFLRSAKMLFLFFAVLCCFSIAASLARGPSGNRPTSP